MKKLILLCLLMLYASLFCLGAETSGSISGRVVRESRNQHEGIILLLKDKHKKNISKTTTIFNGEYEFKNIVEGIYNLEIYSGKSLIKTLKINKNSTNVIVNTEIIGKDYSFTVYVMSNLIIGLILILNFIFIYFLALKKEIRRNIELFFSVCSFTFWFLSEISRFVIGIFDEVTAANLWAVSIAGTAYTGFFLLLFFLKYPLNYKVSGTVKRIAFVLYTIFIAFAFTWLYRGISYVELVEKGWVFNLMFMITNLIFTLGILVALVRNIVINKAIHIVEISKIFLRVMGGTFVIIGFLTVMINFTGIKEPFDGYYKVVFAVINILMYWNILKYGFNFKYMKENRTILSIYVEALKYLLIIGGVFVYIANFEKSDIGIIAIYVLASIFLKVIIDIYWALMIGQEENEYKMIVVRLEGLRTREEIKTIISSNISRIFKIHNSEIIIKEEINNELFDKLEYHEGNIIEPEELGKDAIGFKIIYRKELIGILKLSAEAGKLRMKHMNFLINFSEELGDTINRIIINEAKERNEQKQAGNSLKPTPKELVFIMGYSENIMKKSDNPEIKEMAQSIQRLSERLVEKWEE